MHTPFIVRSSLAPPTPAPPSTTTETAERLRLAVARLARLLRQQDDSGLGPTLTAALSSVDKFGPLTLGELAAREQVAPPTITKVVDKMVLADLVRRRPDPDDGRSSLVEITDLGRDRLDDFRRRRRTWLNERLGQLDASDQAVLATATVVLEALVANSQGEPS